MKRENDLEYIRRRLKELVGLHNHIAAAAGLPQSTVSRIHNGNIPRMDTAIRLRDFLKKIDRKDIRLVVERPRLRIERITPAAPAPLGEQPE